MKVGDRLYCKCVSNGQYHLDSRFVIGKDYFITKIAYDLVYVDYNSFFLYTMSQAILIVFGIMVIGFTI